ncbi:MAG: SIMPL domain-containing protein [Eubacteriales bacterium]
MKKRITSFLIFLLSALMLFAMSVPCAFASASDAEIAEISGRGSIKVPADTATVSFTVESRGKSADDARRQNLEDVAKVKEMCGKYGDIITESSYVCDNAQNGRFTASTFLVLKTDKPESADDLKDTLAGCGNVCLNYTDYGLTDCSKYQSEALELAISDAESKISGLGLRMKLVRISEFGCCCMYCGESDENGRKLVTLECNISAEFRKA